MSRTELGMMAVSYTARAFYYPSLAWNLLRNKLQASYQWFDEITQGVILGAIPYPQLVEDLQRRGVRAVVSLNEEWELILNAESFKELGWEHLHIPTVDFLYAPSIPNLHKGVDFIAERVESGNCVYVHCKAGRGRSTTLVICYLIAKHNMDPLSAYTYVRLRRPQVCLAQGQWEAVCRFFESCGGVPTPETCPSWPLTFSPLPSESAAGDGCAVCGSSPSTVASEGRASPLALPLCVPTSEAGGGQMSEAVEQMLGPDSELPDAVASTREVSEPPGIQQATEGASDTASSCGDGLNCPGGAPQVEAAVDRLLGVGDDEAEHSPLTDCYFNCEEGEASGQSREEPLTDMPGGLEHPLDKSQSDVDGTEGCVPMAAALTSLATVTRRDSTQSALSRCHSEGQLTETGSCKSEYLKRTSSNTMGDLINDGWDFVYG